MKTTFLRSNIVSYVLVLFMFLLQACGVTTAYQGFPEAVAPPDGQVLALQVRTAEYIVKQALSGVSSTKIYTDGNLYMFMRYLGDGWGFVIVDTTNPDVTKTLGDVGGNIASAKSVSDLTGYLLTNGWKAVTASQVPQGVKAVLVGAGNTLQTAATSLTSFIVVPAGIFELPEFMEMPAQ